MTNAIDYNSDSYLINEGNGTGGYARAARALINAPYELRNAIVSEANVRSNVIGERYADSVEIVVRNVNAGRIEFPYSNANSEMLKRENAAKELTGRRVIEPITVAFNGLHIHESVTR